MGWIYRKTFFPKLEIEISAVVIRAYIYDSLLCEGTPENIMKNMDRCQKHRHLPIYPHTIYDLTNNMDNYFFLADTNLAWISLIYKSYTPSTFVPLTVTVITSSLLSTMSLNSPTLLPNISIDDLTTELSIYSALPSNRLPFLSYVGITVED